QERLYLAESAALVIEVKSDLLSQWSEVEGTTAKVRSLRRNWHAHGAISPTASLSFPATTSRVPVLVVAYRGPKDAESLRRRLSRTAEAKRPDAILVVESGAYSACSLCPWTVAGNGAGGLLAFSVDTAWLARNVTWAAPNLRPYADALREDAG